MQVWVEGVAGDFSVDLYEIGAGKASDARAPREVVEARCRLSLLLC